MLDEYLQQFGDVHIEYTKQGKQFFQIPDQVEITVNTISEQPQYAGLLLATQKGKDLIISPNLFSLIAKQTKQKVKVNDNTAWLFICGRDIFQEGILEKASGKGPFIILNEKDEAIGIAKKLKKNNQTIYKNITDIGIYNRREKNR